MPNHPARLSLLASLLTVTFFCIGFAPFLPMTALVCYPAAFLTAVFALISGLRGLKYPIGRWMAWTGIVTGSLAMLGIVFFTTLTALLLPVLADSLSEIWRGLQP